MFPIIVSDLWGQYFERFAAEATTSRYLKRWAEQTWSQYKGVSSRAILRSLRGHPQIFEGIRQRASYSQIAESIRQGWEEKATLASAEGTRPSMPMDRARALWTAKCAVNKRPRENRRACSDSLQSCSASLQSYSAVMRKHLDI